jgi:hypothetical protein
VARRLVTRHAALAERLEREVREAGKHQLAMRSAERALAEQGAPPDDRELAAWLAVARAVGEPRRRLAALQERLRQEIARLAAALAKVPLWERGAESLAALVLPTHEMIDRASGARGAAMAALGDARRERDRLGREESDTVQRLEATRHAKPVPDAAAVAAARARRDHDWSLIRRKKFEGEPLGAEIAAYADAVGLAAAFERAIGDADNLADRRYAESVRLATIAGLEDAVANLRIGIEQAQRRLAEASHTHREALDAWTSLTDSLGLSITPEPADLLGFLAARDAVVDRHVSTGGPGGGNGAAGGDAAAVRAADAGAGMRVPRGGDCRGPTDDRKGGGAAQGT